MRGAAARHHGLATVSVEAFAQLDTGALRRLQRGADPMRATAAPLTPAPGTTATARPGAVALGVAPFAAEGLPVAPIGIPWMQPAPPGFAGACAAAQDSFLELHELEALLVCSRRERDLWHLYVAAGRSATGLSPGRLLASCGDRSHGGAEEGGRGLQDPDTSACPIAGTDSGTRTGADPGTDPGTHTGAGSGTGSGSDPGTLTGADSGTDSGAKS